MQYNKKGFSIILAMGIVVLFSLIGLYLVEYMIPFSRNVKGIENASQAFYESYAGVEDTVLLVYSGSLGVDYTKSFSGMKDYEYSFTGAGVRIPALGSGNAFDDDFSRFSQSDPISLDVGNGRFTATTESINFFFRIPDFLSASVNNFDLPNNDIIIWQLSGESGSLTAASGALITEGDDGGSGIELWGRSGTPLTGANQDFDDYFRNVLECDELVNDCILKISVIQPLIGNNGSTIPYLEYRITSSNSIPYQNPLVTSRGKSFGFSKSLEVFIPQNVTSSAFDFTVLQ